MRIALILTVLLMAGPALASRDDPPPSSPSSIVSQDEDSVFISIPPAPAGTSLYQAWEICSAAPDSEWCDQARQETRIPLFCQRWRGHIGLVDLPFAGSYCH